MPRWPTLLILALALAGPASAQAGAVTPPEAGPRQAAPPHKPPAQVINLGDIRRLSEACEDWAGTLEQATRDIRDGSLTTDRAVEIDVIRREVEPVCLAQDIHATNAGRLYTEVATATVRVAALLP